MTRTLADMTPEERAASAVADECETKGCDLVLFEESDDMTIWHCTRCGAEVWEEHDDV